MTFTDLDTLRAPISLVLKAVTIAVLAMLLSGCFAANAETARVISRNLGGGSVRLLDSGVYEATTPSGGSKQIILIKTLSPTGQRVYRSDEKSSTLFYAFYALSNGRVLAEDIREDQSYYDYVEVYTPQAAGSYGLRCRNLPDAQIQRWFGPVEVEEGKVLTCMARGAGDLVTYLNAALANSSSQVETTYRLIRSLPDEI